MQEKEGMGLFKSLANKVWNFLWGAFLKTVAPKVDRAVENHHMHSLAALTKKNPNMGVHVEQGLNAEEVKAVSKEMLRLKQDIYFQRSKTDPEKFDLYVTSGNKTLLEQKVAEYRQTNNNPKSKKPTLANRLAAAKQKSNALNQARNQARHLPEKHKDVSL